MMFIMFCFSEFLVKRIMVAERNIATHDLVHMCVVGVQAELLYSSRFGHIRLLYLYFCVKIRVCKNNAQTTFIVFFECLARNTVF